MAARHICGSTLSPILCSGYAIRTYIAASRAEVRAVRASWQQTQISRSPSNILGRYRSLGTKAKDEFGDSPFDVEHSTSRGLQDESDGTSMTVSSSDATAGPTSNAATDSPINDPLSASPPTTDPSPPIPTEPSPPSPTEPSPPSPTDPSLPWYLQPTISPSPLGPSTTHPLPPLPPSPPPLLSPLLTHLSLTLGQDDLSLLDLRPLDPPAALGSNLLMILATSRSEKHLHVSADRLCRWLRTDHGLRPFADGLLGRNELKLKMKRKAKRSRLLSAVGAKATGAGDVDEGIRTGWVCVNVGEVEGGVLPAEEEEGGDAGQEGFVGFRTEVKGCRVVVQLMTEERRGALDLESLWTGMLNRSRKEGEEEEVVTGTLERRKERQSPFPEAQTTTIVESSEMGNVEARA
ncbi:hypothetical protein BDZ85DRAFT_316429 [Elsinoe ampelina]|uniref:ATPase synthesis protein 25 n=1 Tax=Elsinoe ampelina TaxID=302913 RepID=A0A6A6GMS8_9PEZI|nr:hypothetical protein BDZ85DRAFT_316429 [Elsinoe ampelina]